MSDENRSDAPVDGGGGDSADDDEPDETLKERLWGLTEMFPEETVDSVVESTERMTLILARVYKFLRTSTWIIVTSALILLAPIYFECTRVAYEKSQQDQFGPCASSKSKVMRKPGSHPCQPFRPQPKKEEKEKDKD